jgi:putative sigma-54 modulation protein
MEILVRGKHFDVSKDVEERAEQKLQHLEHYLPLLNDGMCHVDLAYEKSKEPDHRFIVHVNVSAHGIHLQATGHAEQPELAIDHAAHVLVRQARRQKDRIYSHGRSNEKALPQPRVDTEVTAGVPSRVKRFAMKPMTVVEAMEQIEALGHSFYVFHHVEEESIAVLYRRNAGGYGMILPDLP